MTSITKRISAGVLVGVFSLGGCEMFGAEEPLVLPSPDQVRTLYQGYPNLDSVAISGNVVELIFQQNAQHLRRGGSLWARVGPYIYVFSPATRQLFTSFPDVAAVRVRTLGPRGEEVARAMLGQDALTDILWRRSLNIMGHAVRDGTRRPSLLEELVEWGERHTKYEYNPEYVPR